MWGDTAQKGCFTGYYIVMIFQNPPPVGCPSCATGGKSAGDPIDLATGNMYLRETDYVSADPRLQFSRVYNSISASTQSTTVSARVGMVNSMVVM